MSPPAPGDVVRAKAGGPWMTVESVGDRGVCCVWFTHHGRDTNGVDLWGPFLRETFPADVIEKKPDMGVFLDSATGR